jgi:hypothetical protein
MWVRINAPVDVGIAPVIEALSAFPALRTLASCEGDSEVPATVAFIVGDDRADGWRELADLVLGFMGPALMRELGDRVGLAVRVTEAGTIRGELRILPGLVPRTAAVLHQLAAQLTEASRKTAYSHGTECTSPRDSVPHPIHNG